MRFTEAHQTITLVHIILITIFFCFRYTYINFNHQIKTHCYSDKNMSTIPFKKKLLIRFLNDQQHEHLIQKQDIENAVIEQAQSATQIGNLATNIQPHQRKSTVNNNSPASHIKHVQHTNQQSQNLTGEYGKRQDKNPTLSSLMIGPTIVQASKTASPSTEMTTAPANLYPALQTNHRDKQLLNPFAPAALGITLQNLAIPDFSFSKTLSQNEIILKNEITTQEKLLNYYQKSTTPHSTKILQLLDKILLLKQLQDTLPSFYIDEKTLKTEYINLTKVTLSPASQSQQKSRIPMPDFTPFSKKSLSCSSPHSDKRLCYNPPTSLHSACPMQYNQYQTLADSQHYISHINYLPDKSLLQTLPKQLYFHSCIPNSSHIHRHTLKPKFHSLKNTSNNFYSKQVIPPFKTRRGTTMGICNKIYFRQIPLHRYEIKTDND